MACACGEQNPFAELGEPRSCDIADQNEWVYGVMEDIYLFANDMPQMDREDFESFETPAEMVRELRVSPDRWSRVSDKGTTEALFQEGRFIGFGFRPKRTDNDEIVVASVHAQSPAGLAGMQRGDRFVTIAGRTTAQLDEDDAWGGIYGEKMPGVVVDFQVEKLDGTTEAVTLTKDWIDIVTVPIHDVVDAGDRRVGYLFFETFVGPAIEELDAAFADFNEAGVTDVVIDVRYNGGGLISVSRHLTNLLVGGVVDGAMSYGLRYNDNLADLNRSREVARVDHSLPSVGTVAFLTTGSSLSASELLINAVRAHTNVEIVGQQTGGKPVGSKHISFCESTLAPITFQLVNADEVGDYYDGLAPTCMAVDDFRDALGSTSEHSLAAALSLIAGQGCPPLPQSPDDDGPPNRDEPPEMEGRMLELAGWQ